MEKWSNNPTCCEYWSNCQWFDTKEEAIQDGIDQYKQMLEGKSTELFDNDYYYDNYYDIVPDYFDVGKKRPYTPTIDVDDVIERLQVQAYDECGEFAEDFLDWRTMSKGNIEEDLREHLQDELDAWLNRHNLYPTFFTVIDIETINVKDYIDGEK